MRVPDTVKKYLSPDQNRLYDLIWCRSLSSQMDSAQFDRNTITISSEDNLTICKASGSVIKFDGFLRIMKDYKKDNDEEILPEMTLGAVNIESLLDEQHYTQLCIMLFI